jgi:glycosyltransferase involved in cell wall biosynthesis
MRILNIWNFFQPELKYHVHYLSECFTNSGNEVYFISSDKVNNLWAPFLKNTNYKAGKEEYSYATVYRLRCINIAQKQLPLNWFRYYKLIKQINPDVVHVLGIGNFISWVGLLLIKLRGKKVVIVANDHSNPTTAKAGIIAGFYKQFNIALFKIMGKRYAFIITPNSATKKNVQAIYNVPEHKMKIIPLGYDDSCFYYQPLHKNMCSNNLIAVFAGKIEPRKQIEKLLLAVAGSRYKDNISIKIAGLSNHYNEYIAALNNIINEHSLHAELQPLLEKFELAKFYNYADVAIFPGSISITTVEANGCGCPVLIFNSIEGLEDRIENGRGYLFTSTDELTKLLDEFYVKKTMQQINNKKIAEQTQKYSWRNIAKEYMAIYENA